jgi:GDPmannose 4,6-dehydratase
MRPQRALVTGYTGQDGTFLTKHLLDQGYNVIGLCRRISTEPPMRIRGSFDFSEALIDGRLQLVTGDLLSIGSLMAIIDKYQPDEVYNLAAQSHVGISFTQPESTMEADFMGVVNLVTALEATNVQEWRLYQASTSEMFGDRPSGTVLKENGKLKPNSPYAIAKTAAHHYLRMKRKQGLFTACGILFNHESEIRGNDFVTQKIARAVAQYSLLGEGVLELGNIDSRRDWGYAGDYVRAMHMMLQQDKPGDYVIGTGEQHSVRAFVEEALHVVGHNIVWDGEGVDEVGRVDGEVFVRINPEFYRPNDVTYLHADATKAREELGWVPTVGFDELVGRMVNAQVKLLKKEG